VLESTLQWELLKLAPQRLPSLRLFRRNVAAGRIDGRFMRFGIAGQADLYGIWRGGSLIELELKQARGQKREAQARWAAFCCEWGVTYLFLRALPAESQQQTVDRWIREIDAVRPASLPRST
jgi:hypothetical protein